MVDTHAEQVDLTVLARPRQAEQVRKRLADVSLETAREWTFHVPTTGRHAGKAEYALRVPVEYVLGEGKAMTYGQWTARVPGGRTPAPWAHPGDDAGDARMAGIPGQPTLAGSGLRLSSGLEPGS